MSLFYQTNTVIRYVSVPTVDAFNINTLISIVFYTSGYKGTYVLLFLSVLSVGLFKLKLSDIHAECFVAYNESCASGS